MRKKKAAFVPSLPFLQSTLDALSAHIAILDEHGTILAVNYAWKEFARENGYTSTTHGLGDNYLQTCESIVNSKDDSAKIVTGIRNVLKKKQKEFHAEYPCHSPTTERWFMLRATRFDEGESPRIVIAHEDITNLKATEEALRKSEQKLSLHIQHTPLAVIEWDLEFNVTDWNSAARKIFGYTKKEAIGRHASDLIFPPQYRKAIIEAGSKFLIEQVGQSTTAECRTKNNQTIICEWYSTPLVDTDGHVFGAASMVQDVTDRKKAEEKVTQLASIVASTDAAVVSLSLDGIVTSWNNGARKIYGYTQQEMIGKPIATLVPLDRRHEIEDALSRIRMGEDYVEQFETKRIRKDGVIIDIFLTLSPVKDLEGKIIGISNIVRDITKRIRAEEALQLSNKQLEISNRELQDFASVASHDLQEPLRKIQAFADRLSVKYADRFPDEGKDYLERMDNAAKRMQILINDLLTFSRVTTKAQPFAEVDLRKIAEEVVNDLEIRIEETNAQVEIGKLHHIQADPLQIRQLFQNLISNGIKFRRKDILPVIKIYDKIRSDAEDQRKTPRKVCELIIEDNGIGFDEKYLDRIFNVFQRLHGNSEYEGTGIGLAVCRKIVERHAGSITAKSREGKGSAFIITIPVKQEESQTPVQEYNDKKEYIYAKK